MKKINNLIRANIMGRLQETDTIVGLIAQFLKLPLENRLWVVSKPHRLTLLTDDTYLATQLRFQRIQLCQFLNKYLTTAIREVDIKVISLPLTRVDEKTGGFHLSADTANVMNSIAQGIEDQELREAVMQLALIASQHPNQAN